MQPRLFSLGQVHLHLGCQDQGDLVLDGEDVVEGAVIALRPDVRAAGGVDKLRGDADAVRIPANAPLQHVPHAELPGRITDIDAWPL